MKNIFLSFILLIMILPGIAHADIVGTCNTDKPAEVLCNPISHSNSLEELVTNTMTYAGTLIGLIAIVMLVYAGIRMITANGNDKTIGEARSVIYYTILGFVASILAYAGIVAIESFIGVDKIKTAGNLPFNPLKAQSLEAFTHIILKNTIQLSGLIAVATIVWFGFRYLTARGDENQVKTAKTGILWSLVGLAIIIFAYVIISAVAKFVS